LRRRKKRAADYLRENPNAATVIIERSKMNDILTVHSVDGREPIFDSRGTKMCFYINPGEHTLSLSYLWIKNSLLGKLSRYFYPYENIPGKDDEKRVFVKPRSQYRLRYDHEKEEYLFTEQ
jgi:hypothetical protein